ncbi:MAG: hypothetical protein HQ510_13155 [Candidatus Marinimicrobia bacterium]|nr:hypothetical protein [Candidatus Neomarinimicrobiota bacterium]
MTGTKGVKVDGGISILGIRKNFSYQPASRTSSKYCIPSTFTVTIPRSLLILLVLGRGCGKKANACQGKSAEY